MTRNKKILIVGAIILLIGIPVGIYYFLFSGPEGGLEMERIVINLGTTEEELIPELKKQGYIRSEWAFRLVLKTKAWQGHKPSLGFDPPMGYLIRNEDLLAKLKEWGIK